MRIRGDAQESVQKTYSDVRDMLLRFVMDHSDRRDPSSSPFAEWIVTKTGDGQLVVARHAGGRTGADDGGREARLAPSAARRLAEAWVCDPETAFFQPDTLRRVVAKALTERSGSAVALADFAVKVHPSSPVLLALRSEVLEWVGDIRGAAATAAACAGMQAGSDWRTSAAILECTARAGRLSNR